ncbi:NUDIX domain-containing protein [Streptomyces sp. NRRL B-1347]|uniref:NUDIX domain-containing protein n=1 Tax=Streptomyces sp. NRRL B-1347 TaxID=1476877 RepID=UPI0005691EC8|nr:NUDIX hydrolase [Streptomyces sp. NRRL B-1347]
MGTDIDPAAYPRRIGVTILVRDPQGHVLMVKPTYKHRGERLGWQLLERWVEPGETLAAAAAREVKEVTGLTLPISHFLGMDQMPKEGNAAESYSFVCHGGTLSAADASAVGIEDVARGDLSGLRWVPLSLLDDAARCYEAARVRMAVRASENGIRLPLLLAGEMASA